MTGFLLNMINRHQGLVDKVQPRIKSMFEPEPATAVAADNAFESNADAIVKESLNTGFEKQSVLSKSPIVEKPIPENPPSVMLRQPAQTDEGSRVSDLHSFDRNRMDLMNEQIQGVLARLGRKSESQEPVNGQSRLQNPAPSSVVTEPTTIKAVVNETGLTNRIEETLSRLKNQTRYPKESQHGFDDHAHTLPANVIKTEPDSLVTLSPQPGKKVEESSEPHNKSITDQTQTVNNPINSQDGSFQIPDWLTGMQTDINNRWREINAKSQAEPVINVTIGRVEVRAINMESAKPGTASKKPTGVMSLDDYLKQRESKGRT